MLFRKVMDKLINSNFKNCLKCFNFKIKKTDKGIVGFCKVGILTREYLIERNYSLTSFPAKWGYANKCVYYEDEKGEEWNYN